MMILQSDIWFKPFILSLSKDIGRCTTHFVRLRTNGLFWQFPYHRSRPRQTIRGNTWPADNFRLGSFA